MAFTNRPADKGEFIRFDKDEKTGEFSFVQIFDNETGVLLWSGTIKDFRRLIHLGIDESQRVP